MKSRARVGSSTRLTGHSLYREGDAYRRSGQTIQWIHENPTGPGVAVCECGATSETLKNRAARKHWHREHKDQYRPR